jgi:type IV pilus assembly protein PilX
MRSTSTYFVRSRQQGAVLYIALILLLILTVIGVAASRLQTGEAVMARNDHNHQLAMQAAEAALRNAEINVIDGTWTLPQFLQNNAGLYVLADYVQLNGSSIVDQINIGNFGGWSANFPNPNGLAMTYTGPALVGTANSPLPQSPMLTQVIIEDLPPVARPGDPLCTPSSQTNSCSVLRITVHAVGGDASASATLQSVIH